MKVEYSKSFQKAVLKLSGKYRKSVAEVITEVKNASSIEDITDCKKLKGLENIYRIVWVVIVLFFSLKYWTIPLFSNT